MDAIEIGLYHSQRGVEVRVTRIPVPDAPHPIQQLQIQYGLSQRPGTTVWYPDVPRCWRSAQRVIDHFIDDRDNLGRSFRKKLPQRVLKTCSGGYPVDGIGGIPGKAEIASYTLKSPLP